jgi:hypothetical protein
MENMSLTNDDKNWIASAIASATGELSTQRRHRARGNITAH